MSKKSSNAARLALGQSVLDQIIFKQSKHFNDQQADDMKKKVETSCDRFDKRGKGRLTVDEFYNVVKLQNKLDCSKEQLDSLTKDLDKDKDGRISIKEFVHQPIISRAVFDSIDRNKDGRVSKGELKLAAKGMSMAELVDIINEIDKDKDGMLTFEEVRAVSKKAFDKWNKGAKGTSTFSKQPKSKSSSSSSSRK